MTSQMLRVQLPAMRSPLSGEHPVKLGPLSVLLQFPQPVEQFALVRLRQSGNSSRLRVRWERMEFLDWGHVSPVYSFAKSDPGDSGTLCSEMNISDALKLHSRIQQPANLAANLVHV